MARKQIKICERMLFTWLMSAGLIFLFVPRSLTNKLQLASLGIFHRPLSICRNFTLASGKQQSPTNVAERNKYIKLRNHLANNIQWLRQERENVEKLSGLRNRSVWEGVNFVLADVITSFMDASRNEFIINRGKNDGLCKGQFVLGQQSIIGTISELDSRTARVQLLTDPESKIAVKIGESKLQGIMQGDGNSSAKIQLLAKKHKIKIGEIVYVRKKPGFLGISMIAGTVVQCKTSNENALLWDITVKPACELQKLNSVAAIVVNPNELVGKE